MVTRNLAETIEAIHEITRRERVRDMRAAFAEDPERAERFSAEIDGLALDFSRYPLTENILAALFDLADATGLAAKRDAMFAGETVNNTEGRAALHIALRDPRSNPPHGAAIAAEVAGTLRRMEAFAEALRSGQLRGATGQPIRHVVNIGIGGSDLGPAMATLALRPWHDGPELHFVSNVDGAHIADTLALLDAEATLFIVASKTFTTVETMTNAATARQWLVERIGEDAVSGHFAAVTTATGLAAEFGIEPDRMFGFSDWVGGRYSVWSPIGLPLMIAIGPEQFRRFLAGGHAIDRHFTDAPWHANLPVLLGLIGWWQRRVLGYPARAIIPYEQRLARFPAYLQQLDMESNGKGVRRDGLPVTGPTGPLVFGEPGTNGQHAFFQLLHQGTDVIPIEFLIAAEGNDSDLDHHHRLLIANCLAQAQALSEGRSAAEAEQRMIAAGMDAAEARRLAPHRAFAGNRPSFTLLYRRLDPYTLGQLIALYEHRVFVEAVLFDINPFDQWGVELGKELATALYPAISGDDDSTGDAATRANLARIRALRASR